MQMDRCVNRRDCRRVFCLPAQMTAQCAGKHVIAFADREPIFWMCASRVHGIGPVSLKWMPGFVPKCDPYTPLPFKYTVLCG
jgi:hypothetical protein